MKKKYVALFIVLVLVGVAYAATRNLVPRADGEGGLGTAAKRWGSAHINTVFTDLLDVVGAADMDYGSADVTDHTFLSDGTGTGEFVLKAGAIDGTEILDNTVDSDDYAADSIDNEHINWADIDNLGDEGAVTLAGLATTLTITDNENTAENNPLVFVENGDLDGGNLGLESDGTCYYTPSTGVITATGFAGSGASLTSVDAATGDSATAFFDAGTIAHEYGGLEADINAYTGLVAISGGSTSEIDAKSELEGQIADVADFAEADGDTWTGTHDMGGASVEIPNVASGDLTLGTEGQLALKSHEDGIAYHSGATGEISGEVFMSFLPMIAVSLDPGAWYDSDTEVFLFKVQAKKFPNGIIIDYWECSCNVDPDVEMDADLRYADAWIGLANAADIDEIDTTNGVSSEDTDANINSGNAVAAGKVIYIGFDADPEGTCTQMHFEMLFHAEED